MISKVKIVIFNRRNNHHQKSTVKNVIHFLNVNKAKSKKQLFNRLKYYKNKILQYMIYC